MEQIFDMIPDDNLLHPESHLSDILSKRSICKYPVTDKNFWTQTKLSLIHNVMLKTQ